MIKRTLHIAGIILANILLFFLLAELFAVGWYLFRDGTLHYSRPMAYSLIEEVEEGELTHERIHPYFGFIFKPGHKELARTARNNHGFVSVHDYPLDKKGESSAVIGIFGGSVAEMFCLHGRQALLNALRADEFFQDKKIHVLNFSRGGYKQPQQLQVLTYFLAIGQPLDLVINIDGYNELALASRNVHRGVDFSFPSTTHILGLANLIDRSTLTAARLHSLDKIVTLKERLNRLVHFMERCPLAWLDLLAEQGHQYLERKYQEEISVFDQLDSREQEESLLYLNPSANRKVDHQMLERIADLWAESSLAMHQLLTCRGIPYFHFIQPNQYFSKHRFGEEETRIALTGRRAEYLEAIKRGYPLLLERLDHLRGEGVNIQSEVELFDDVPQSIYIDNCCHFNVEGIRMMAEDVSGFILASGAFGAAEDDGIPDNFRAVQHRGQE